MLNTALAEFQPILMEIEVSDATIIDEAEQELGTKAAQDPNRCMGYFPALASLAGIDTDLSANRALADMLPEVGLGNKTLKFNFTRLSLVEQNSFSDFHLDSDSATALTGEIENLSERLIWRLLMNLSTDHPRRLVYADVSADTVPLSQKENYIHAAIPLEQYARSVLIPPRHGRIVQAVLFCSNRLFHGGRDDSKGHFVGAYGCEEEMM